MVDRSMRGIFPVLAMPFDADGNIAIDAACAQALEVAVGDEVWSVAR